MTIATNAVRRLDDGATAWTDERAAARGARRGRCRVRRHADRVRRRGQAGRRRERGLRARARRRRVDADRPPARPPASTSPSRPTAPGGRSCSAAGSAASTRTSRIVDLVEGTSDVHDDRRAADEARWRRRVLVAVARRLPGRRRVTGRHEPAGRVHGRRRHARPAAGPRRRASRGRRRGGRRTAYVVLGGRQPGLFTSDVTETLHAALTASAAIPRDRVATSRNSGCAGGRRGRCTTSSGPRG